VSVLLEGARRVLSRRTDLDTRVAGLAEAVEASRGRLDDADVDAAEAVVERASARLRLSSDHTVVALAGATGSGKSSTFNALADLDLAAVGVRRPTTSWATACVWGQHGAGELLEWLGIPLRHQTSRDSMLDTGRDTPDRDLQGLVLLDLPDHDSTELTHHLEVDRLVELADLMIWVLDPQKYADAAIHDRFLRPLQEHRDVMLVVLNHLDEIAPERRESVMSDVRRLLVADGLGSVPLLGVSAKTGLGIDALRAEIARRIADKALSRARIETDVRVAADRLAALTGDAKVPELGRSERQALSEAVADAAGVPVVVDAVRAAAVRRARRATGWPLTAWLSRFRPDPLRRLHLDLSASEKDLVRAARTSLRSADRVQQARVDHAVRALADAVTRGLTRPWAQAVRRASLARSGDVVDGLDRAMATTDLGVAQVPGWCRAVRFVQWVLLLAAIAGAVWLGVLAISGYLRVPQPRTPQWLSVPVPTWLLVGGVLLGILLALVSRVLVRLGARARAARAERRLRAAVDEVTRELVLAPIEAELDAYRRARDGLVRARS
jgi:GTP-binding protein EngB required for normal cell division